ncbi:MAG: hypothetical protein ACI9Z7_001215 [Alteromonas macleodii]|jgi:hypothetical protein
MGVDSIVYFRAETDDVYTDTDLITILDLAEKAADCKPFLLLMVINEFEFLMTKEARGILNIYDKSI